MVAVSTKSFHIGDILSVMTGRLVSPDHIGGVYRLCDFMTGESLMTHQLPRVTEECEPFLREQFPDLAAIEIPDDFGGSQAEVLGWLDRQVEVHGATRDVAQLATGDHTHIDPLAEIAMMRPDLPVIGVVVGDD